MDDDNDGDDGEGSKRYLPDENGMVWEHVELGEEEDEDRLRGSRKCDCHCHTDADASQQFQSRLRHCVPCAKVIVNGRLANGY